MLIKVSWRNIWRHRIRSLVLMSSVASGIWAGIFIMAFTWGMYEDRIKMAIEGEVSHIQIHEPEFTKDHDPKYIIRNSESVIKEISSLPGVKAVTGRTILIGMLSTPSGTSGIKINSVTPESEKIVTGLDKKIFEGGYFNGSTRNGIIISSKIAGKMKVRLRSKVVLTFQNKDGDISAAAFRIIGIYRTINAPFDQMNVFITQDDVNSVLAADDSRNEIAVLLKNQEDLESTYEQLRSMYGQLKVEKWQEIAPDLDLMLSTFDVYMLIFMGIIMLALAFGIVNIMLMSVLERKREIGMLMSIGMNKLRMFSMILLETAFLVVGACPAGLLLSYFSVLYFGKTGIDLSIVSKGMESFGFSAVTYPALDFEYYIKILLLVVVTAFISSLYPARKALKLKPVESIRKM